MGQHPRGERFDVKHACPDCPTPGAGGIWIPPSALCPTCRGTGLVTTAELGAWQAKAFAENPT
jgi:DnaJ-class molecular chaperone